jgi:hypothetical protein
MRNLILIGALVVAAGLGGIGLVGPDSPRPGSAEATSTRVDAGECDGRTAGGGVTSTSGPDIFYDPDGPGPAVAQEPVEGYDADPDRCEEAGGNATSGAPARGAVLIYDPSGIQGGTTFTVFADLVEAAAAIDGGGTIFVPDDATIDAPGEYDLNYFGFASNGSTRGFSRTILTIPDGVTFKRPGYILAQSAIVLYSTSSEPVVSVEATNAESSRMFILENDGFVASKAAPFFELSASTNTSYVFISMRHGGGIAKPSDVGIRGGDHESVQVAPGNGFVVLADVAPPLGLHDGTVRGEGTVIWNRYTSAIFGQGVSPERGSRQPNAPAFRELINGTTALLLHDQADAEDWMIEDGSTAAASLDELADRVRELEERIDEMADREGELEASLKELTDRVDELERAG